MAHQRPYAAKMALLAGVAILGVAGLGAPAHVRADLGGTYRGGPTRRRKLKGHQRPTGRKGKRR